MPLVFLHNEKGVFINNTGGSGIADKTGWWNSLLPGDFDNDGDIDYIAGNLGLNSFYRASTDRPVAIRAKDFDGNGSFDAVPSLYLPATLEENSPWLEFPAHGRDDMIKQMIGTRVKFQNYKSFAHAIIDSILTPEKMKGAIKLTANYMASAYIQNDGSGHFTIKSLPMMAQFSALNGMVADDFDGDGNLDIAINTNDYGTDPTMGRYDALNGLVLKGDGTGSFVPLSARQSGIFINGNGKGLGRIRGTDNRYLLVATQNRGPLQVYKDKHVIKLGTMLPGDVYVTIVLSNGKKQRTEIYYGSSFLSQSSRFFVIPAGARSCTITDYKNASRQVSF